MRMDSSSGKSTGSRCAICSGLHDLAQRRSCRLAWLRPFQRGATGPDTTTPSGRRTCPTRRSWTYSRSRSLATSLAVFGRRATSSAFHCATPGRYSSFPPRVAALRRSSREIVDGSRPRRAQQRDLLALREGQVPTREPAELERRHAATLAEPPAAGGLRRTDRDPRVLAGQSPRDEDPELALDLPSKRRRPRRLHRRPASQLLHPPRRPAHQHLRDQGVATTS